MSIDREDLEEAIEIACGDSINADVSSRRTASQNNIDRLRSATRRLLHELPRDTTVQELLEALDEQ